MLERPLGSVLFVHRDGESAAVDSNSQKGDYLHTLFLIL